MILTLRRDLMTNTGPQAPVLKIAHLISPTQLLFKLTPQGLIFPFESCRVPVILCLYIHRSLPLWAHSHLTHKPDQHPEALITSSYRPHDVQIKGFLGT